jgi:hypothetical protein
MGAGKILIEAIFGQINMVPAHRNPGVDIPLSLVPPQTPTKSADDIRLQYKPSNVRRLFICESSPFSGTFFYNANSELSRYTQDAFSAAFESEFADGQELLGFFKSRGCYLIDLRGHPINHLAGI